MDVETEEVLRNEISKQAMKEVKQCHSFYNNSSYADDPLPCPLQSEDEGSVNKLEEEEESTRWQAIKELKAQ